MNILDKTRLLQTSMLAGLMMGFGGMAHAQDVPAPTDVIELDEEETFEEESFEDSNEIVVTGSRLKRNEFTSASPLKILNVEESLAAGVVDTASIIQRTSIAGGTQFDNTFTGQVTDSGPGSATVSLRGLDAERTLVLSNGRRLAPAGVRGAPTRPDLNLIPLAAIERIDVLADGASSVYGADAVAGVINIITKKDFDGLEVDVFTSIPEADGGEEIRLSAATGVSNDRGNIGFGFEFYKRQEVLRGQRDFTPCIRDIEINPETGERREICTNGNFSNQFLDATNLFFGDVTNDGLGQDFNILVFDFDQGSGFEVLPSNNQPGAPGPALGNLFPFTDQFNANDSSDTFQLSQPITRYSGFLNGEYDLQFAGNAQLYFEGLYSTRSQEIFTGASQVFPTVPCSNPFIQADPTLSQATACTFGPAAANGLDSLIFLPRLDAQSGPINLDVTSTRGVLGITGDLEYLIPTGKYKAGGENFGFSLEDWTYDVWGSLDVNTGVDRQRVFNDERLFASLSTAELVNGEVVCGLDGIDGDLFGFISAETCVPIDVTDPALFLTGQLPQDALDFVSGLSLTTTTLEQQIIGGSISGQLAYLPAGKVPFVAGFEYREDDIETLSDFTITSGANTSGRTEGNTIGGTNLLEAFFETEIPLLKGQPFAEELTVTGAARWSEEQNFGALWTYRVQGIYRPLEWLTGRASFGTTYRAPNLREQNLASQVSFAGAFSDPCIVGNFNAIIDPEEQARVRANCELQGADPDNLGAGGATAIPVVTGGTTALNAETSEAFTAGFVVEQPWFDSFDLSVAATYFNIEIENSIEEPTTGFILNECINQSTNLDSPFCSLIQRADTGDGARNFINLVDSSFVNVGLIETDGVDLDVLFRKDFTVGDKELNFSSNLSASSVFSNRRDLFNTIESFDGRPNNPHWRGDVQTQVQYADWAFNHNVRYIGATMDDDIDALRAADIVNAQNGELFFAAGFRDVEETGDQFIHDFSVQYNHDTWNATLGVRNAFDREPPLVDEGEGFPTSANVVLGGGFDVFGRTFFARVNKRF